MGVWTLGILRNGKGAGTGELVHHPEGSSEWQRMPSEGDVGGEKVIPGHPEAICCLFLPQAGGCSLRYDREDVPAPEAPDAVFPADGIPSVLWEVLPALRGCPRWLGPCASRGLGKT